MSTDKFFEFLSGLSDFFTSDAFIMPFLSTVMASLTIIFLQFANRRRSEKRKKLYAINYIVDVCFRILFTNLHLRQQTVLPHIEAVKRMISGDEDLLKKAFLVDEFDILTDGTFDFNHLPEEYKVLLGCDDITLVQLFEGMSYINTRGQKTKALNNFVNENLKSEHQFRSKGDEEQLDCLNTYWDYLGAIDHSMERTIFFVVNQVVPVMEEYVRGRQFILFSKKSINQTFAKIDRILTEYEDVLPAGDFLERAGKGGIKNAL